MAQIFQKHDGNLSGWKEFSDIDPAIVAVWKRSLQDWGVEPGSFMKHRLFGQQLSEKILENIQIIESVRKELDFLQSSLAAPYLFIFTDANAVALHMQGSHKIVRQLNLDGHGEGTSFAMAHAGINAISVAAEMHDVVVVRGNEHTLEYFNSWFCVCAPLSVGGRICGYLDLSFSCETDAAFAVRLLKRISGNVEARLAARYSNFRKASLYCSFEAYGMTTREKEIAYLWLNNETIASVAAKLLISRKTVQAALKKIYKKTNVGGRIELVNKFPV